MSNTVQVGFVGVGWMGEQLLRRIHEHPSAGVAAVFDVNRPRTENLLRDIGLKADLLVQRYEDLVARPEIDTVFLVSPNTFHGGQAVAALQAGKHVFCEKPSATVYEDFLEEVRLDAVNPQIATMVDYILYFDQMENTLHKFIQQGAFGDITQIQVNYRHPVNISGDKAWKLRKEIVGDAIGMGPIHAIFTILWHMEPVKPVSVYAVSMEARVRGFEVPPVWNIMIEFENGCVGMIQGNIDNGNRYDAYHNVYGTQGGFVFDSQTESDMKVKYWSEKLTEGKWVFPLSPEIAKRDNTENHLWSQEMKMPDSGDVIHHQTRECVDHFLSSIENRTKSPLSFSKSAVVGEVAFACLRSAERKEPVGFPLSRR